MKEISYNELKSLPEGSYKLIDIRRESLADYGMMPGALNIPFDDLEGSKELADISKEKKLIFYCEVGKLSKEIDDTREYLEGRDCYSLAEGYMGYIRAGLESREDKEEKRKKAELSIRKKYHKQLFSQFAKACKTYKLINPGDHIAVCISGGKDSMLMAKLFQEIQTHRQVKFDMTFLVMDPGYNKENRELIEKNAEALGIPITIFESTIFDTVDTIENSPCYLCARMRRGYLYSKAKELGCNKIALGHHYDDVIETILMGMVYGGQIQTMMPKLHSTNFEGMELIRPMYLIREADIKHWRDYNDLHFIQCACKFTDTCTTCEPDSRSVSKRLEIKNLIAELKKVNPQVEKNIFRSVENVNVNTVIAYKDKEGVHRFTDSY